MTVDPLPFCNNLSFDFDEKNTLRRFNARHIITTLQNTENSVFTETVSISVGGYNDSS